MHSIAQWWLWISFLILILGVLGIDLVYIGGKRRNRITLKESFYWTGIWVSLALLFNLFLWFYLKANFGILVAHEKAMEFFTAYLVEESLSMDNIFVFILIFKYYAVPLAYQRRLLLYGVVGAIVSRLIFILLGIWLLHWFDWIFYFFGFLLLYSAFKFVSIQENKQPLADNFLFRFLTKFIPLTHHIKDDSFFVREKGRLHATPLFIVLLIIEMSDLVFATDSIPAVFGITKDPFIAFSSNAFAVLGLRSMYFILANIQRRFYYLNYGLAIILCFIGIKMILHDFIQVPAVITLSFIVFVLGISIVVSKLRQKL